ncbi:unnamed protein product [Clavelina lepadiformis]|uniref:Uncharacterized protein n=1 Tax=Clavelina lepadiformis TaxID=159417 RepID=A0ABP0FDJ2_CLALP
MEISPQEAQLVEELKDVCDQNGKETEGKKSAPIFHKLGLFYRKLSPDKISLIQSSVLLVAARIRQPDNEDFKRDLKELFAHVLDLAKSFKTNQNLEQITLDLAEKLKWMREEVQKSLAKLKVVPYAVTDDKLQKLSTTLFIAALGRICDINKASCFDIIEALYERKVVSEHIARQLNLAVALACEVRLKVYMRMKSQDDLVGRESYYSTSDNKIIDDLVSVVGERCLVDYFVIAHLLQMSLRQPDPLKWLDENFCRSTSALKFNILHYFNFDSEMLAEWERMKNLSQQISPHDKHWICYFVAKTYEKNKDFDKSLPMFDWLEQQQNIDDNIKVHVIISKAWGYRDTGRCEEGVKYIKKAEKTIENLKISETKKKIELGWLANTLAGCHWRLKNYKLAYDICKRELLYYDDDWITHKDFRRSQCLFDTAKCALKLGFFEEAICSGQEALQIRTTMKSSASSICECRAVLGKSYEKQGSYAEAADQFSAELEMRKEFASNAFSENDDAIKLTSNNLKVIIEKIDRNKNCQIF